MDAIIDYLELVASAREFNRLLRSARNLDEIYDLAIVLGFKFSIEEWYAFWQTVIVPVESNNIWELVAH